MEGQENILMNYHALLRHATNAFLITDAKGKILYVNTSIEKVTGLKAEIHLGKYVQDLLNEKLITSSATLDAIIHRKAVNKEVDTVAGRHLLSSASPVFNAAGRLNRVVCNIKDITSLQKTTINNRTPAVAAGATTDSEIIRMGENYELIFAGSSPMRPLVQMAIQLGKVDSTVLITGETGVGKELIARLIHKSSSRSESGCFVKINCASLSENLFEAELFGYMPGTFTGALKDGKIGYMERADGGTLFLDEVGELSLHQQARLLSVLQDREIFRIGSTEPKPLDLRIIAATNHKLEDLVANGRFRKDLFYRLNVITMQLPPLRERKDDIPVLTTYFFNKIKQEYQLEKQLCSGVVKYFHSFSWPGNVRELANLVENMLITTSEKIINISCLPAYIRLNASCAVPIRSDTQTSLLKDKVKEYEKDIIRRVMDQSSSQVEAAKKLGISRASLLRKLK